MELSPWLRSLFGGRTKPRLAVARGGPRRSSRSYAAGDINRLTDDLARSPRTHDSHAYQSLRTLRARCRQAARDEGMARRYLGLLCNNVVGPAGIQLQAQPRDEDGTINERAANSIEDAWADWSRPADCDIRRRLNFAGVQRLALRTVARDGEALVEEVVGDQAGDYGYSLQMTDPELLDIELNQELTAGHRIVMGVEFDRFNRAIAYHLIDPGRNPSQVIGGYYHSGLPHRRVPAERMIHLYMDDDPAQTRGIPWMANALYRLQQIGAGTDAATVNFRIGSMKVGFIETPEGGEVETTDTAADGSPIDDLEPGTIERLSVGEKFVGWDPNYPNNEFAGFVKAIKRDISSGLETSYNRLASDYEGVSFSAGRLAGTDDRDVWRTLQAWLSLAFCQRVFEAWLRMAITSGRITVPSRNGDPQPLDITRLAKYRRARWQGRGWESNDPLKDILAARMAIALGMTTVSAEIRKTGRDPQEVFKERAGELEILADLGVIPPEPALDAAIAAGVMKEED